MDLKKKSLLIYKEKCQRCQRHAGIISYNLPYTPECVFESKHSPVQSFSHLCRCESVHTQHGVCLASRGETQSQSHDPNHRISHADSNTSLYFCVQVKKENFAPLLDEPCLIAQHLTINGVRSGGSHLENIVIQLFSAKNVSVSAVKYIMLSYVKVCTEVCGKIPQRYRIFTTGVLCMSLCLFCEIYHNDLCRLSFTIRDRNTMA